MKYQIDPVTGATIAVKKLSKGAIAGMIAGGVVVATGAGFGIAALNGAFDSPQMKVVKAFEATLEDKGDFMEDMDFTTFMEDGIYSVTVSGEISSDMAGVGADGTVAFIHAKDGIEVNADGKVYGPGFSYNEDGVFQVTDEAVRFESSLLGKNSYAWYYTEGLEEQFADYVDDETMVYFDNFMNDFLSGKYFAMLDKEVEILKTCVTELEVESIGSESFEIDGKDRKCSGYEFVIDSDAMEDFLTLFFEESEDNLADFIDLAEYGLDEYTNMDMSYDDYVDYLIEGICQEMDDYELVIDVYLYKGKLAAINGYLEDYEDYNISLEFNGGEYRMQNMTLYCAGDEVARIEGDTDNGIEDREINVMGVNYGGYSYDKKENTVEIFGYYDDMRAGLEFEVNRSKNALELTLSDISVSGFSVRSYVDWDDLKIVISNDASLSDLSGREVNLSEMDLEDVYYLFEDVLDKLD